MQKTCLFGQLATHLGPELTTHCFWWGTSALHDACSSQLISHPFQSTLVTSPISPLQYRVIVPLMGAVSDLCEALSRLSGIAAENVRRAVQWHSAYWGQFIVLWS